MSLNQEVDLLRNIPLFSKIDPARLKLLAFASERLTFAPNQELFHQGDHGDAAYIVIEGAVDILVDGPSGNMIKVASLGKNELIGEIAILVDIPRTATARAAEEVTTLVVSKELFFRLVIEFPEIGIEIMRELAQRLEKTTNDLRMAVSGRNGASAS